MTYGWNTKKTAEGFEWSVYSVEYMQPITVLQSGVCATRTMAAGKAKQWVYLYRFRRDTEMKRAFVAGRSAA